MRMTYKELKDEIAKMVPRGVEYTVDLEGGNIAILTTDMKTFSGSDGLIGKIAKRIKRKIVLRTPQDRMKSMDDTKTFIEDLIPDEAEITEMYFDGCYGEVIIQCKQPSTAVGRRGEHIKAIRDATGWSVNVERTPPCFPALCMIFGRIDNTTPTSDESCSRISGSTSTGRPDPVRHGPE